MKKPRVLLRADGSREIGFGHMSRTLALASMLSTEFDCWFVSCSTAFESESQQYCSERVVLNCETHFEDFLSIVTGDDIVVLDNYFFEAEYQRTIKNIGCKLVCIDDIHETHFYADIVINHAEGITSDFYTTEVYTKLLLGYKYALLRPEFLVAAKTPRISEREFDFMICLGGGDPLRLTPQIAAILLDVYPTAKVVAIYREEIRGCKTLSQLSAKEMISLFETSKVGIFPASTVAIEAIACRIPFACGFFVDNQKDIYAGLEESQAIFPLHDMKCKALKNNLYNFLNFIDNKQSLGKMIDTQQKLLDCLSGERLLLEFRGLHDAS